MLGSAEPAFCKELNMSNELRVLTDDELDLVSGGDYYHPKPSVVVIIADNQNSFNLGSFNFNIGSNNNNNYL